ncbi:MAG: SH3 domain-containing protein, partial [Novosphingobium sp.]|nr:SH3 domain-containing protein [Novosphingobium sp.]
MILTRQLCWSAVPVCVLFILIVVLTIFAVVLPEGAALAAFATVSANSNVNARSGPGTTFGIVTQLSPGDTVEEIERQGDWSHIRLSNGGDGWVNNAYLNSASIAGAKLSDSTSHRNAKAIRNSLNISVFPQLGHSHYVSSIAFSSDGRLIVSGDSDGNVIVWNEKTAKQLRTFKNSAKSITALAFSPDGRRVAVGSDDSSARVWDISTGTLIVTFEGHSWPIEAINFTPDGRDVLTTALDAIRLWDAVSGAEIRNYGSGTNAKSSALRPDGWQFVTGDSDNTIKVWSINSGQPLRVLDHGLKGDTSALAFGPGGDVLATAVEANSIKLWNLALGKQKLDIATDYKAPQVLAFSPDGGRILAGFSDGSVAQWETSTGKLVHSDEGTGGHVPSLTFSADRKLVAYSNSDNRVVIAQVSDGTVVRELKANTTGVISLATSTARDFVLAAIGLAGATKWDLSNGKLLQSFKKPDMLDMGNSNDVERVAISADKGVILTGSSYGDIDLWNMADGELVKSLEVGDLGVTSAVFTTDGKHALVTTADDTHSASVWDLESGKRLGTTEGYYGHTETVNTAAYSPSERSFATGSDDGTVRIWDAKTSKYLTELNLNSGGVEAISYSPDGHLLLAGMQDGTIQLWNLIKRKELRRIEGHSEAVNAVAFSVDGLFVLSASNDKSARIWEISTGKEVMRFEGHFGAVNSAAFGTDDETVVTGSSDGTTRVWRTSDGKELASFVSFIDDEWVVVTPEGFFNASAGGTKYLNVVKGLDIISIDQVYDALYRPDLVKEALAGDPDGKLKAAAAMLDLEKVIDSGFPPQVKVVSPVEAEQGAPVPGVVKATGEAVEVEMELSDHGGGFG